MPHWEFRDSPRIGVTAQLGGVVELDGGRLWLPPQAALSGFEEHMPHLRRADGGAVIFPAQVSSQLFRGEDYRARLIFAYADEALFFRVGASDSWSPFSFDLNALTAIGLRDRRRFDDAAPQGLPAASFPAVALHRTTLSLPLARRVTHALLDGALSWTGSAHRLLDDPQAFARLGKRDGSMPPYERSGVELQAPRRAAVIGGYASGRYTRYLETAAWLE